MMQKQQQLVCDNSTNDSDTNKNNSYASSEDDISIDNSISIMEKIGHEQNFNVICAKGRFAYNNAGNKRFRQIVKKYLEHYDNASNKIEKSKVVTAIIEDVRMRGNFMKHDAKTGTYVPVSNRLIREKVGQGLRDALHMKYKSSWRAKKRQRLTERKEQDDLTFELLLSNNYINDTISHVAMLASTEKSEIQLMEVFENANRNILQELKEKDYANLLASFENRKEESLQDALMPISLHNGDDDLLDQSLLLFDDDEFDEIMQSLLTG